MNRPQQAQGTSESSSPKPSQASAKDAAEHRTKAEGPPPKAQDAREELVRELTQANALLRESEARCRVALGHSALVFAQTDRELRYTWIQNPHPDFQPEGVLGKRDSELSDNEGTRQLMQVKQQVIETGQSVRREIAFPVSDSLRYYEVLAEPMRDASGQVCGVTTCSLDITARKLAAQRDADNRTILTDIFELTLSGYWDWNLPAKTEYLSPAFKRMFGYEDHELPNSPDTWQHLIFPEDLPGVLEVFDRHVKSRGREPFYNEVRYRHKDGSTVWVICAGRVIEWAQDGSPVRLVGCHVDITRSKQVEEEFRASEERFRALATVAPVGIYRTDPHGKYVFANHRWLEMAGMTLDEARGDGWAKGLHPDDRAIVFDSWNQMVASKGHWGAEYRFLNPAGVVTWVFGTAATLLDPDGTITGYVGINVDITERKRLEGTLRQNHELLSRFIEHSPIYAYIKEVLPHQSRVLLASGNFKDMVGIPGSQMRGKTMEELFPADFAAKITADDLAVVTKAEVLNLDEHLNGRHYATIKFPITFEDRHLLAGYTIDITERKRAEEALQDAHRHMTDILAGISDGLFTLDEQLRVTHYNPAAERLLGRRREEILGRPLFEAFPEARGSVFETNYTKALREKRFLVFEVHFDVPPFVNWYDVRVHPIRGGLAVFFQVTTQRKIDEERARQAEKMAAIGQLAGGIAHDFNNQLGCILGFAQMLEKRLEDSDLQRYADNIMRASRRAADLTAQLLAFGRKGKYLTVPTDMHKVLAEVVELLRHSIDKRIVIHQHLEAMPSSVLGDPTQLQNAILNLALNARDAMPHGGVLGFATRTVAFEMDFPGEDLVAGRYVQVSVTDTGLGMDDATKKHLFEPFFTTKEVGKGTGLGLASVYGTVKNHHGSIRIYSEPGRGSSFHLYLPAHEEATGTPGPANGAAPVAGHGRILVVDDEVIVLEFCGELLRDLGYAVTACADPVEALDLYRREWRSIDLVLLDMVMPNMSGYELFAAMKELNPRIRALLSSGYSLNGEAQSILDLGALAFIQKPFDCAELARNVAAAIAAGA